MRRSKPRGKPEPGEITASEPPEAQAGTEPEFTGQSSSIGLTFLSYMIGGMILYGGIGWLIGHWTHLAVLFPVGMLTGLALSVALIIFRVTRS